MSFSKQLTQLGLLGSFTLAGLSACTTCPGYRTPHGLCGPSQTVVTTFPPVTEAAPRVLPTTPPAAPPPPHEAAAGPAATGEAAASEAAPGSTLSVPGSIGQAPTTGADSGSSKPSDLVIPPPAPPAVPPAPAAAESNHDQPRTQKPLDAAASAPSQPEGPMFAAAPAATSASSPPSASVTVTTPKAAPRPRAADHQVGPLAKLRARFHNLIQPPPKTAAKSPNGAKVTGPGAQAGSPPIVATVRIPLPTSDPNRVVQEDSRAAHTILPDGEGQVPVTTGPHDVQTVQAPADVQPGSGKAATTREIEQWPFGPQASANPGQVTKAIPTDDFDPIPVDEYQATIVRANDANSLPTFDRTSPSQSRQAANGPISQPLAAAQNASGQGVPKAVEPSQEQPMPVQGNPAAQVEAPNNVTSQQPVSATGPLQQTVPTAAAGAAGPVAPAIGISADQSSPTTVRPVRPAQWIGGRYGQPAWMVPYMAEPQYSGQ